MIEPWRVVARRRVFDGGAWLQVHEETVELPSGRRVEPWFVVEKGAFVVVAALTEDARFVVRRAYRHGPRRVTLDLPAGHLDAGEPPLDAARRELREETGYEADSFRVLGSCVADGNATGATCHLVLARGARRVGAPAEDETEAADVLLLTAAEMERALAQNEFHTLAAVATVARALVALRETSGSARI